MSEHKLTFIPPRLMKVVLDAIKASPVAQKISGDDVIELATSLGLALALEFASIIKEKMK